MIAQKVEDMLGKVLASFLLPLLGDGAIEASSPGGEGEGGGRKSDSFTSQLSP